MPHHDHKHDHDHHHHHHHDHHHDHHHHHAHHKNWSEQWWEDLSPRALKAAEALGYTMESWDGDEGAPYDGKSFSECTLEEKHAARIIGYDPIDQKLDIWWEDADEETQKYAKVLGWDEEKWDDDWDITDLECEDWWWKDMTPEQREAAEFFGYDRYLWDEIPPEGEEDDASVEDGDDEKEEVVEEAEEAEEPDVEVPPSASSENDEETEEKKDKDDEEEEEDEDDDQESPASDGTSSTGKKKKPTLKERFKAKMQKRKDALLRFSQSEYYGAKSGDEFNHGNNRHIDEMTIFSDKNVIHGIEIQYKNQAMQKAGSCAASGGQTFKFRPGEFITSVKIRSSNKNVTGLSFMTNKHCQMGPLGGSKGTEVEVKAPFGCVLCGLMGYSGKHINALAFRWGPKPVRK